MYEETKAVAPHEVRLSKQLEAKIPKEEVVFYKEKFVPEDFTIELRYSLWTDLCGEQTEFQDALEQISYFQILKINVFNLFDFSTMSHEMIQA